MSLKKIIYASLITFLVIILTSFLLLKTNFVKKFYLQTQKQLLKIFCLKIFLKNKQIILRNWSQKTQVY